MFFSKFNIDEIEVFFILFFAEHQTSAQLLVGKNKICRDFRQFNEIQGENGLIDLEDFEIFEEEYIVFDFKRDEMRFEHRDQVEQSSHLT